MSDIKPFNPNDMMGNIRARIQDSFVQLIPDEEWDNLIKREVHIYFHTEHAPGYSGSGITPFQTQVRNLLQEEATKRFRAYLSSEDFEAIWDGYGNTSCSKAVEEFLVNNSGQILTSFIGGLITNHMMALKSSLTPRNY